MANYKRGYPRSQSSGYHKSRLRPDSLEYWNWMCNWPRWWDVVHHSRPKRRDGARVARDVMRGWVDADEAIWPLGNHKPHRYYW